VCLECQGLKFEAFNASSASSSAYLVLRDFTSSFPFDMFSKCCMFCESASITLVPSNPLYNYTAALAKSFTRLDTWLCHFVNRNLDSSV
jgi:hypothetical protein